MPPIDFVGRMSFYGDPDALLRLAKDIRGKAEQVRARAADLDKSAKAMAWQSVAADRCQETLREDQATLTAAADRLDNAAAVLEQHAEKVRAMIAEIARIAHAVGSWFDGMVKEIEAVADKAAAMAKDAANAIGDAFGMGGGPPEPAPPPWEGWKYGPDKLPPPGDKEWLEVGEFMTAKGVL